MQQNIIGKHSKEENHLKLLESVITNTTDAVLITEAEPFDSPGPRILYVNKAFTMMTGYSAEEVIGKNPRILQGPKTDKEELKRLGKCIRNWESCEATIINYKKNGEEFWIHFSLCPVADENGWFTHWISIDRDVTHQKNKELQKALLAETSELFNEPIQIELLLNKLLKKVVAYDHFAIAEIWLTGADNSKISLSATASRSQKKAVFYEATSKFKSFSKGEGLPGAVWKCGKILVWNHLEARPDFLRYEAAQNIGLKIFYGIPLISEKVTIGVLVIGLAKERPETSKSLIPLFEKLSTRFGMEIKRKQLEEELHQVFSLAPDIICIIGMDRCLKKLNPAMINLLGYTEAELLSRPLDTFLHPNDQLSSRIRMEKFIAGEKTEWFENRFITKKGEILWLSWTAHLNDREGLLFCVGKDITTRKVSDGILIESKKRYSELFQLSPLANLVFDLETLQILDVNKAALNQYGYTKDEFLQMSINQLRIEENPLSDEASFQLKQPTGVTSYHAVIHKKKNGETIIVDAQSNPIFYKGKNARIGIARDITESLKYIHTIEEQNQKLKEISWMQSHVVRAPLARLMGLIALLDINEEIPSETRKIMAYLLQSAHELDNIIMEISLKTEVIAVKKI